MRDEYLSCLLYHFKYFEQKESNTSNENDLNLDKDIKFLESLIF